MSKYEGIHPASYIAEDASVKFDTLVIGENSTIENDAVVSEEVTIGRYSQIGARTYVGYGTLIGNHVQIGPDVRIESGAVINDGAGICQNALTEKHSSDARKLLSGVMIGENVLLHDEVELGTGAIIPTQRTIASIGHFGSKNRVVTIYGSDTGMRISVGCRIGVTLDYIREQVAGGGNNDARSAQTYAPYLDIFMGIGAVVQKAYESESRYVAELKAQSKEHQANLYNYYV